MAAASRRLHRAALAVAVAALTVACLRSAPDGSDGLRFPPPGRAVPRIVSSAYSDEATRDTQGEFARVVAQLGLLPATRVADIGAGDGYYTVRLARHLGPAATIYAQDIDDGTLKGLTARLAREGITNVTLVRGTPRDPRLPEGVIDLALLSHVYHEIENPFEFLYRLWPALARGARVAIIDADRPPENHGTPPALLTCEMAAMGYRQIDHLALPPESYLAVFVPPATLPPVASIKPCS